MNREGIKFIELFKNKIKIKIKITELKTEYSKNIKHKISNDHVDLFLYKISVFVKNNRSLP